MNHSEIARELQVTRTCVVSDVQYLRSQAKDSIREYVTEHLPEQYQVCLTALDTILKHAFEILLVLLLLPSDNANQNVTCHF